MKILYLRSVFLMNLKAGGSVGHTAGVINAMQKAANVSIVSNDNLPGVSLPIRYIRPWLKRGLPTGLLELLNNVQFILALKDESVQVDYIYHRHGAFAFAGACLARRHHIPLILEFNSSEFWKARHWKSSEGFFKGIFKAFYHKCFAIPAMKKIEQYNLENAALVTVVSEALKENLVCQGVPADKILVNPNGVDEKRFQPGCGGEEIRWQYHLEDRIVIGFIGTFGQWHGIKELARAIVMFFHEYPQMRNNIRFFLIGDGVLMQDMRRILSEGGAESEVILPGLVPQDRAPAYLDACDIFVSPHIGNPDGSKFFGSPTKLFEYMAMGRGIVASNLDQIGGVLEHKKTAWLVAPGDVEDLVRGMAVLARDRDLRERLGKAAREEVLRAYTWEGHMERLMATLREQLVFS